MIESHFAAEIQSELKKLLQQELSQYSQEAIDIAIESNAHFLQRYDAELESCQQQIIDGDVDADHLRWLLDSREDMISLDALKKEGLANAALDDLLNKFVQMVIAAAHSTT